MIEGYVICLLGNAEAREAAEKLNRSIIKTESQIDVDYLDATTPLTIRSHLDELVTIDTKDLRWTWPVKSSEDGMNISTGLYKKAYAAEDINKVVACMVSHMRAWEICIQKKEPIVILEQDAIFTRKFDYGEVKDNFSGILGLNDPRGATRKGNIYHDLVSQKGGIQSIPSIDSPGEPPLPNGLPGNSAYVIKPVAAKKLMEKVSEVGMWPNDALMCRQFFPWLRVAYPYYTKVQGTRSSTTK